MGPPAASRSACRADILARVLHLSWIGAVVISAAAALPTPPTPPAFQTPVEPNPLTHLGQNLGQDLKDFASVQTLAILGIGASAAIVTSRYDDRVYEQSLDHPPESWTKIGRVGGDGWTQGGIAIGTWAIGSLTNHRLTTHVGSDLMRAQTLNMVTTRVTKIVVNRSRPSGGGHAFPSGHTSATFATAGVLHRHFGWKAGVPAYAAAGFVGLTRVRDRSHWVSDTVFGAALGLAAAWTVTRGHDARSWSITPVATPGGGALVVRW